MPSSYDPGLGDRCNWMMKEQGTTMMASSAHMITNLDAYHRRSSRNLTHQRSCHNLNPATRYQPPASYHELSPYSAYQDSSHSSSYQNESSHHSNSSSFHESSHHSSGNHLEYPSFHDSMSTLDTRGLCDDIEFYDDTTEEYDDYDFANTRRMEYMPPTLRDNFMARQNSQRNMLSSPLPRRNLMLTAASQRDLKVSASQRNLLASSSHSPKQKQLQQRSLSQRNILKFSDHSQRVVTSCSPPRDLLGNNSTRSSRMARMSRVSRRTLHDLEADAIQNTPSLDDSERSLEHRSTTRHRAERSVLEISSRNNNDTKKDLTISLVPGLGLTLRGSEETIEAIGKNVTTSTACMSCNCKLYCVNDAEYVLCPSCRIVSPLSPSKHNSLSTAKGGVGLGVTQEQYREIKSEATQSTASQNALDRRQYQQQQQPQPQEDQEAVNKEKQNEFNPAEVPGLEDLTRRRGSEETIQAIKNKTTTINVCMSCSEILHCVDDAEYVLCPSCQTVSPCEGSQIGGGVGLGFTQTQYELWRE